MSSEIIFQQKSNEDDGAIKENGGECERYVTCYEQWDRSTCVDTEHFIYRIEMCEQGVSRGAWALTLGQHLTPMARHNHSLTKPPESWGVYACALPASGDLGVDPLS